MHKATYKAGVPAFFILAGGIFWFTLGPGSTEAQSGS
jgi:hypothetical protein